MRWNAHHCTSAVFIQYKISNPDRDTFAGQRMQCIGPCEDACYGAVFTYTHTVGCLLVPGYGLPVCSIRDDCNKWMLRSKGHKGHAKDRIWPSCVHLHTLLAHPINRHLELKPLRATNPITLYCLHSIRPVELTQVFKESLRIAGQFEEPLL